MFYKQFLGMPGKNKANLGFASVFLPMHCCARCLLYSIAFVRHRRTELIFCGIYVYSIAFVRHRHTELIFCGIYDRIQNVTHGTCKRKNTEDVKYNEKTF